MNILIIKYIYYEKYNYKCIEKFLIITYKYYYNNNNNKIYKYNIIIYNKYNIKKKKNKSEQSKYKRWYASYEHT